MNIKRHTLFPNSVRRPVYAPTVGEWLCMCLGILAACAALWFFVGCTTCAPAPPQPVETVEHFKPSVMEPTRIYLNGISFDPAVCSRCHGVGRHPHNE